jgi:hypothetical protein
LSYPLLLSDEGFPGKGIGEQTAMKSTSLQGQAIRRREQWMELAVVFTTVQHTLSSLQAAAQLTNGLEAHIQLLAPDFAPGPAFLITPRTLADFTARYFLAMLPHPSDLQIKVTSYPATTGDLWEVLPPHSLVIMTGKMRRFRLSAEQRFARRLQQAGHEVIFLPALE